MIKDSLEYDFSGDDVTDEGGGICIDDLYLTSDVHDGGCHGPRNVKF